MRVKIIIGLCLISILFLSGCTEFHLNRELERKYFSVIGEGTVEEKAVEIPDVIVIDSIKIPALAGGRVKPDRTLDIIVTLKNRDEDKIIPLDYVGISDLGIFTCEDENNCNFIDQSINPGQLKTFSFTVKTPSNDGTIALPGHLEFSVKYRYTSTRLATITFIGKDDYMDYLESDGKVPVSIINIPSDGPVELDLDISNIHQPVVINKDKEEHQIYLEVLNKGSGEIDMIKKGNLKISFEDMNLKVCSKEFGGNSCDGTTTTSNNESIVVRGSDPFKYYFSFIPNTDVIRDNSITATKKIEASAEYTYRLPKTIDILVSPRAEI